MDLDPDRCYRALMSRDARFDGRFFVAVRTTGIYCRPICPAPKPKLGNCRFLPSAAAAEQAGFRPCLRCRPEAAPGTPAWSGTGATISRALRLIAEGALDTDRVDDLAGRLGIGARHLRRLFVEHLGAPPILVAQTQRVHLAKRLIDETSLPMHDIAISSGFSSVRRFNDAIVGAYGLPPSRLRNSVAPAAICSPAAGFSIRLAYRPPYPWDALMRFLAPRATPGVETVTPTSYRRTVRLGAASGLVEVRPSPSNHHLVVSVRLSCGAQLTPLVGRIRRMFDLGADPTEVDQQLLRDRLLAPLVRSLPGLRVPVAWDCAELAVRAILGQQVSVKGATTLAARLVERFGEPLPPSIAGDSIPWRLFPTALRLAEGDVATIGIPAARAATIRSLAAEVAADSRFLDAGRGLDDVVARLCGIPGIGPWTAHYIAMRGFGEPDAFPANDMGLLRAVRRKSDIPRPDDLVARAEAWRPWRAYGAMHLWMSNLASGATRAQERVVESRI
jgi:AraC family transcriptional regulator, regulatory protein of adaptative response / DNA-3-methyladenine glycosylase II